MNSFIQTETTVGELSGILGCGFKGDGAKAVRFIGDAQNLIRLGTTPESHCIYYIESKSLLERLKPAGSDMIVLCSESLSENFNFAIITKDDPKQTFIKLLEYFEGRLNYSLNRDKAVHETARLAGGVKVGYGACIGEGAVIGEGCVIQPNAVIEPFAKIGKHSVIHSGVYIARHCVIGEHCIIYPNSVIGADGFGYTDYKDRRIKIPQIGNVVLGDFVEVGACTTIDRSTIESTIIGKSTKIDNLVQIAHNCIVGENVYIAGKASMAGSVTVKDKAILAGGCGIRDHVTIAEGSIILAFTGIEEDTEPGATYFGIPARKALAMHRINSALGQLPDMLKSLKRLEKTYNGPGQAGENH